MNFFDMINSQAQKANGINDTIEAFIKDKTNPRDTIERTKAQAEGAYVLDEWLRSFGVNLNYNYGLRNHMAEADAYAGAHIQDGMEKRVNELGVDIRTAVSYTHLGAITAIGRSNDLPKTCTLSLKLFFIKSPFIFIYPSYSFSLVYFDNFFKVTFNRIFFT